MFDYRREDHMTKKSIVEHGPMSDCHTGGRTWNLLGAGVPRGALCQVGCQKSVRELKSGRPGAKTSA